MSRPEWRAMAPADLDGVVEVAASAFPDHFEERACFAERLTLFPAGCFALANGAVVFGYCIAYPWPNNAIPPLNTMLGELSRTADTLYLHDLALLPTVRGQGHVRPVMEQVAILAKREGLRTIALVSVNGTVPFWRGMGFEPVSTDAALAAKLSSYGAGSAYMIRHL